MDTDGHRPTRPDPHGDDGAAPEGTSARGTPGRGHFRRWAGPRARRGNYEGKGVPWRHGWYHSYEGLGITPRWVVRQNCWFPSAAAGGLGAPTVQSRAAPHLQNFFPINYNFGITWPGFDNI